MNDMKVENLNAKNISAALSLINRTYADVHGFTPLTESDWNIKESASCFLGFLDEKLVSLAYGSIAEKDKGRVRWACSRENARSECYTLLPMEKCITDLKYKSAKQIRVDSWLDAPYRRMLSHFESKRIHVEHDHLWPHERTDFLHAQGVDDSLAMPVVLSAGGCSFHHSLTVHGSGENRTAHRRRGMVTSYMRADSKWVASSEKPDFLLLRGREYPGCV